jgi:hypothetical protein
MYMKSRCAHATFTQSGSQAMHDLLQLKKHDGESETFRSDLF